MTTSPRDEARRLRTTSRMSIAQLCQHFGVGKDTLAAWLAGIPAPEWTRRPNAKDELRVRAAQLRVQGFPVPQIAGELGVSKSTAYQWTKHIPLDPDSEAARQRRLRHSRHMTDTRWEPHRRARDAARAAAIAAGVDWVGALSDREVLLLGAAIYWCEGGKAKPWRPNDCRLRFINSDPVLIALFLRFLELLGVQRGALTYRLSIHESADADEAGRWWATTVGVPYELFRRPTLKKHNPATVRHNVGEPYRGCLMVAVPKSSGHYWRIEGIIGGIAAADPLSQGR